MKVIRKRIGAARGRGRRRARWTALFCGLLLLAGAVPAQRAAAADTAAGRLQFWRYDQAAGWEELSQSQLNQYPGQTIRAAIPAGKEEALTLLLGVYDKGNCLTEVHADQKAAGEAPKTLMAEAAAESDQTLRCFLFDSLAGLRPVTPGASVEGGAAYADPHSLVLSWPETLFPGAESYQVSRDGAVLGVTDCPRFVDNYLMADTLYGYTIAPVTAGVAGKGISFTAKTGQACTVIFEAQTAERNLTFLDNHVNNGTDSYTEAAEEYGRTARLLPTIPWTEGRTRTGMAYFLADRGLAPGDAPQMTFEITYFDKGTGALNVGYNTATALAKDAAAAQLEDTMTWRTARLTVTDANFRAPAALQSSDFRVAGPGGTLLSRVSVAQSQYFGPMPVYAKDLDKTYSETGGVRRLERTGDGWQIWAQANAVPASARMAVSLERAPGATGAATLTYQTAAGSQSVTFNRDGRSAAIIEGALLGQNGGQPDVTLQGEGIVSVSLGPVTGQRPGIVFDGADTRAEGIALYDPANQTSAASIGGKSCRMAAAGTRLCLQVDDAYAYGKKDGTLVVEVDCYDNQGDLNLIYDGQNGAGSASFSRANSGGWITVTFRMTDAALRNGQAGGDLCLQGLQEPLYVREVRVRVGKTRDPRTISRKIFLAGDSLCEPLPESMAPREGWGMEIGNYFQESVQIVNKAKGGKSSRTFLSGMDPTAVPVIENDGRMEDILAQCRPGDYLFVQFGHNDRPNTREVQKTDPSANAPRDETSYRYNLERFYQIAQEHRLNLVFLTSLHERKFSGGVLQEDGIEDYRQAMREVGAQLGVPVLDVGAAHTQLLRELGSDGSAELFVSDNTHITKTGAVRVCKMIVQAIREGAAQGDPVLTTLAAYLKP